MKIGCDRICLTPQEPFYLIGYRAESREHPADGVHDDIYGNALLFEGETGSCFIFSADVIEFEADMAEEVKTMLSDRFGIDRELVILCATHDHSSLMSYHRSWYTGVFSPSYYRFLLEAIAGAFERCRANARPASAAMGARRIDGYFGNRIRPDRPADNEARVLAFRDRGGKPFAGIVNWAVHSSVIGPENTLLSGDLAGAVCARLGERWGFHPAFVVGAAGDCSTRGFRRGHGYDELGRVSGLLADEIAAIAVERPIELSDPVCQTMCHTIHHDMGWVRDRARGVLDEHRRRLEGTRDVRERELLLKQDEELASGLEADGFHMDIKAAVIQMGDLQIFVFPGELGGRFGTQLKRSCLGSGVVAGYANGRLGYFLPEDEYDLSFETEGTGVPPGDPERLVEELEDTARRLWIDCATRGKGDDRDRNRERD